MERQLVTIQRITDLIPIPDADAIELAQVMGWQAVVKKGDFKVGDLCVYFEIDSYLPIEDRYEFLRKSSYRNNEFMGEGFRIRTMKLRGALSQGLIVPITECPEVADAKEGDDVTDILNVKKWFLPEVEVDSGIVIGDKPHGIPTTNELRVQSVDKLRQRLMGKPYYITTKMEGTSMSVYCKDGKVGVTGRNDEYQDTEDNSFWKAARAYNLPEVLKAQGRNLVVQGELCGHGIQGNKLRLREPRFYIFDIMDLDAHRYLDYAELQDFISKLDLDSVPIEEVGESFDYTLGELLELAKGKYESGTDKEGIVVRAQTPEYIPEVHNRLSFKVLNNMSLLKEK